MMGFCQELFFLLSIYAWNFWGVGEWDENISKKWGKDPGSGFCQNGGTFHFLGQLWFLILDKPLKYWHTGTSRFFLLAANSIVRLSQNEATPKFIGFTRISKICVVDWQKSSNWLPDMISWLLMNLMTRKGSIKINTKKPNNFPTD